MAFQPMPLSRKPAPFNHPEWVFELKYDGFRSLAIIHSGRCELISRNGHPFNSFSDLRKGLTSPDQGKTVLDGEIVCLDKRGKPQFNDLLFHRGEPCFFAFDLLMADGKDLRAERLTDRKHELRRLLSKFGHVKMECTHERMACKDCGATVSLEGGQHEQVENARKAALITSSEIENRRQPT